MTSCGDGLEIYARIPDSSPELQWVVVGVIVGWFAGISTYLFWQAFWKRQV